MAGEGHRGDPDLLKLHATQCAICGPAPSTQTHAANFDSSAFNEAVFSARRVPDRIHYRMVRCDQCGLVRSDPVGDTDLLNQLYVGSSFDYGEEVPHLTRTYTRYLARAAAYTSRGALLEVGCGNGFVLDAALSAGWTSVAGVEPSAAAVAAASPRVAPLIKQDIMHARLFGRASFDVAAMFQVFDHLPNPGAVLDAVHECLAPNGVLLLFNHDVEALSARLLGEASPIIDIEHTYLYSLTTLPGLLQKHGFSVLEKGRAVNSVTLRHLAHLAPLPRPIKRGTLAALMSFRLAELTLSLRLGNLFVIARRDDVRAAPR